MRGKVHAFACFFPLCRITPAYAGKSHLNCHFPKFKQDHPRLCGEKNGDTEFNCSIPGSPPPMRGKEDLCAKKLIEFRITPAYAGKRFKIGTAALSGRDHPRLCGEKVKRFWVSVSFGGSPPPMRGKEDSLAILSPVNGITPAYAGKSFS